jgi:autophagy-related protein 17
MLATTDDFPESLSNTILSIRNSLPMSESIPSVKDILASQESSSTTIARHLESLAGHYDQMAGALRESEAGEAFSEEDLQGVAYYYWVK